MSTGSPALDRIVERLGASGDPKRRYEYVLWLAKKLEPLPDDLRQDSHKVRGCVSQVYVVGSLTDGHLHWQGDSDAQITKGLLALLIEGMEGLTPAQVATIESVAGPDGKLHPVQQAFRDQHGLQCGYCTPGMVMSTLDLLKNNPKPSATQIREQLEGNLCRCTGYHNIVKAVQQASEVMAKS